MLDKTCEWDSEGTYVYNGYMCTFIRHECIGVMERHTYAKSAKMQERRDGNVALVLWKGRLHQQVLELDRE